MLSFGEGDDAPAITATMRDIHCSILLAMRRANMGRKFSLITAFTPVRSKQEQVVEVGPGGRWTVSSSPLFPPWSGDMIVCVSRMREPPPHFSHPSVPSLLEPRLRLDYGPRREPHGATLILPPGLLPAGSTSSSIASGSIHSQEVHPCFV